MNGVIEIQHRISSTYFFLGENQIVIVPGANTTLSATDIDDALELIKKAKVVAFQFENPIDVVRYGLQLVKKHKGMTSVLI